MEGHAVQHDFYREWRMIPTGKRREKSIHIYHLEIHPNYPHDLDDYSETDVKNAMEYILREGAPSHRLYVMPNSQKQGSYHIIGWKKIYDAYMLLGMSDFIPTLCYFDSDANEKLWKNWRNCPGEIIDIK